MTWTHAHLFVAVLILVPGSHVGRAFAATQAPDNSEPFTIPARARTIVLQLENDAGLSRAALSEAQQLAARIYLAIGVQMIWVHGEVPLQDPRGLRVHVRLLSRKMADRKIATERIRGDVLGQANRPARLVYVFCARIGEASVKYLQEYTRLLGLVMAHEIGHILLPVYSHSQSGIMSGRVDIWSKMGQDFAAEEGAAIRLKLRMGSEGGPDGARRPSLAKKIIASHRTPRRIIGFEVHGHADFDLDQEFQGKPVAREKFENEISLRRSGFRSSRP